MKGFGENGNAGPDVKESFERIAALVCAVLLAAGYCLFGGLPEDAAGALLDIMRPREARVSREEHGTDPETGIWIRLADIDKDVGPEVIVRLLGVRDNGAFGLAGDEPAVLIYHTHDTEAYRPTEDSQYVPSGSFRTEDDSRNVYAVGEELKRILKEEYGVTAIHAAEKHEKPLLTEAYSRSLETMLFYKEKYPSIVMFIDIHRDGVSDTGYEDDFVTVDGLECARMMFVVGTGTSGKSSQYAPDPPEGEEPPAPDFESNYALAAALTERLLSYNERFMRNIRVKSGNYNQQVSSMCLLVEVGHNGNTLEQAKNSMIYLARAIAEGAGSRE